MFHTRRFVGASPKFCFQVFSQAQRRAFGISNRQLNSAFFNQRITGLLVTPKGCLLNAAPLLAIGAVQKSSSNIECMTNSENSQAFLQALVALMGDLSSMTWNTILSMLSVCYRRKRHNIRSVEIFH